MNQTKQRMPGARRLWAFAAALFAATLTGCHKDCKNSGDNANLEMLAALQALHHPLSGGGGGGGGVAAAAAAAAAAVEVEAAGFPRSVPPRPAPP